MNPPLRIGVLGYGVMGRRHARVLSTLKGVDLVAIADPASDRRSMQNGVPMVEDLETLLNFGIDMCVVAAPTEVHVAAGLALAAAGVHCMIEKPLATDTRQARILVDAFSTAGVIGCVGHIERFNPAIRELYTQLRNGTLGRIYQVSTSRQGPESGRIRDVGVIHDLATHDFDLTAWITNSRYTKVSAQTNRRSEYSHEDLVAITGRLANGTVANHLVNWLSPIKNRRVVVTGEHGSLMADTLTAELFQSSDGGLSSLIDRSSSQRRLRKGWFTRFTIPKFEPLHAELTAFRAAVQDNSRVGELVSLADGLEAVAIADAVMLAAQKDENIVIEGAWR